LRSVKETCPTISEQLNVPVGGFSPTEIIRYHKNKFANGRKYTLVDHKYPNGRKKLYINMTSMLTEAGNYMLA
jgi:hypothetical protein